MHEKFTILKLWGCGVGCVGVCVGGGVWVGCVSVSVSRDK